MIKYVISLLSFISIALVVLAGFGFLLDERFALGTSFLIIGVIAGIPWIEYTNNI